MPVWSSKVGEILNTKPDNREEAKLKTNLLLVYIKEIYL